MLAVTKSALPAQASFGCSSRRVGEKKDRSWSRQRLDPPLFHPEWWGSDERNSGPERRLGRFERLLRAVQGRLSSCAGHSRELA